MNVTGGSLFGVPIVLIGHTDNLAWSHTVSTAFRFTPFELKLVPGSPTSYVYDGQTHQMTADKVTVQAKQPDGSIKPQTRTLYSSLQGPIFNSILGLPLFPWTPTTAYAMGDVNGANFRYLNHFFETNLAQSVQQLDGIERKYQGIPWVNTIAADSSGKAYYADIGAIPNVPDSKSQQCVNGALGVAAGKLIGLPVLDGSTSACAWGTDPDAAVPGIFGPRTNLHCSATTTSRTQTIPTGSRTPSSRSRASRGSSATRRPRARCARGSGCSWSSSAWRAATASPATSSRSRISRTSTGPTASTRASCGATTSSRCARPIRRSPARAGRST